MKQLSLFDSGPDDPAAGDRAGGAASERPTGASQAAAAAGGGGQVAPALPLPGEQSLPAGGLLLADSLLPADGLLPAGGLLLVRGARAAQAAVLARLDQLAAEARREPALLGLPVRVIVPSRSLRRHVAAQLVRPRAAAAGGASSGHPAGGGPRRAVAGVVVQTLYGVACEVLERGGRPARRGVHLFETLVERAARREPILRRGLGDLVDGFLSVAVVVADLLDAAFEPAHAEALDEALASDGPRFCGRAQVERARALVRVAARTEMGLRAAGLGRRSTLLREAAEALAAAPDQALPARSIVLHGFIAPSGVAVDLLAILCRRPGALLVVDQPPRPSAGAGGGGAYGGAGGGGHEPDAVETAATARLVERAAGLLPVLRLGHHAESADAVAKAAVPHAEPAAATAKAAVPHAEPAAAAVPPARLAAFTAVGAEAEAREVARRLRLLLDGADGRQGAGGGAAAVWPEGLAVVARDLAPYRAALRRHLSRLNVPFSGIGEPGGLVAAGRRAAAALDLLRLGPEAPADRWLDACANLSAGLRVDLSLALRALGAARLRDVAGLRHQPFSGGLALPIRHGLQSVAAGDAANAAPAAPGAAGADGTGTPAGFDADRYGAAGDAAGMAGAGWRAEPGGQADTEPGGQAGTEPGNQAGTEPGNQAGTEPGNQACTEPGNHAGMEPGGQTGTESGNQAGMEPGDHAGDGGTGTGREAPLDEDGEGRAVARARRISGERLRWGVQAAARVHDRLASQPRQAAASEQFARLRRLLEELGLGEADQPLAAALAQLEEEVPAGMSLDAEELRLLMARALGDRGQSPLGGAGGGVQVLSVAEARGRTFDQLFLVGLNRDQFPRPVREDPLLADDLRLVLRRVLPDLPLRRDAFDDERHAFAQLLSAAPAVCLSWRIGDDDGKPLPASPLVERLLPALAPRLAPAVYAPPPPAAGPDVPGRADVPRPADEHAILAGLYGSRRDLGLVLPLAVAQVRQQLGRPLVDLDMEAVAAGRLRVLEEQDPDPRTPAGQAAAASLGPYFGFVGARAHRPGHGLHITHLEALAACPWQLFLGRVLRLERPPDPLGALPGADPLRLGNLVHRALDRLIQRAIGAAATAGVGSPSDGDRRVAEVGQGLGQAELAGRRLGTGERQTISGAVGVADGAATRGPAHGGRGAAMDGGATAVLVRWPPARDVEAALTAAAAELLAEDGLALPGWAAALAAHALPFVEAARQVDWPDEGATVAVVASEVAGELVVERPGGGPALRIRCRADREDRVDGRRRFTDYKTGKPMSEARDAGRRRQKLLADIRAGSRLQAVAYLLAAGQAAEGRYLFLRPDLPVAEAREVAVETGDAEALAAFDGAIEILLEAWDAGAFFPRLLDPAGRKEPPRCQFCAVAEACVRSDPAARGRLWRWTSQAHAAAGAEAALLALWELPRAVQEEDPA